MTATMPHQDRQVSHSTAPLSPEEEKLAELILYITEKSSDDESFGATKLNKILHAADFLAFADWGEAITGVDYFHLPQGPAPRRYVPVREHLTEEGRLVIEKRERFGHTQHRPIALDDADLSNFEAREISIVDEVIRVLWGKTAKQVSEGSHVNDISLGWQLAGHQETIPYESVFVSAATPSEGDFLRARELAEAHGWIST